MIGCHRHVAEQLRWDEQTFDGWHGYDVDFTYRAFQSGFNFAVTGSLPLVHYSSVTFQSAAFEKYAIAFGLKFPHVNAGRIPSKDSAYIVFGEFDPHDESLMRWLTDNFHSLIQQTGNLRAQCAVAPSN